MVSPNLAKHAEDDRSVEINGDTKKLFQVIYSEKNKQDETEEDTPKIRVSTLISRVAFFYEKVRNAVDYEEEHLLRKNAIARILRRQIVIEGVVKETDSVKISEHLLVELIRGSYLPNNKIPETKIAEISALLEKYISLKNKIAAKINADLSLKTDINKAKGLIGEKNKLIHWIISLAACEIEENLGPNPIKQTIVDNLFSVLHKNVKLPADLPYENDLDIQLYLSIGRTFSKFDTEMLGFILFKYYNPQWMAISDEAGISDQEDGLISEVAAHVLSLRAKIDAQLAHPLIKQLDRIVRVYALYFSILSETIEGDPAKVYNELQGGEKSFMALVRKVCNKKYLKAKSRLWRAALRGIIYIFLTKSIFVVLIEVPAIKFFNEPLNPVSLGINIAFPAVLLFVIVFFTHKPGENNTAKILGGIKEVAFSGSEKKQPIVLRRTSRRNWLKDGIFHLIYAASFCFTVFVVIWALDKINFNWVSVIIFLFFLAFVSFFSVLTTKGVKELIIVERKENLFTFLVDLFYMPIILVGRWLSSQFSKINVFIFLFDFIIETPFKVLVEIAEDWTKYVRERRDNMD